MAAVGGRVVAAGDGRLAEAGEAWGRRARYVVWLAFLLGIVVSLAANIAAAPSLAWKPVLRAGWPPVALLLSVELLAHRPAGRVEAELGGGEDSEGDADGDRVHGDPLLERARRVDARHRELPLTP
ncbi:hypothetical protein RMT89_26085 [Streptomyces sp. P17]|nr:hypothetical protein [Streptomyces sp. P17]MDT9699272.1 hypothetical protein [Streptomyces sp. P17]